MKEAGLHEKILGRVAVEEKDDSAIGYWKKLPELYSAISFREVIFCEGVLPFSVIIEGIRQLPKNIRIKFHAAGSSSIVGSDSKDKSGEAVSKENGFNLSDPYNRRVKRLIDVFVSFFGLITFPVQLFVIKKPFSFFANCFTVLFAQKTWIGYSLEENKLPPIRKGIIKCNGIISSASQSLPAENLQKMDYWYARDYEPGNDLKILWKMYRLLGG